MLLVSLLLNCEFICDYVDDADSEEKGGRSYAVWSKDRRLDQVNIDKIDPDSTPAKNRLLELSKRKAANSQEPVGRKNSPALDSTPLKPIYERARDNLEAVPSKGNSDNYKNPERLNLDRELNHSQDVPQRDYKADIENKSIFSKPGIRPFPGDVSTDYSRNSNQLNHSSLLDSSKPFSKDRDAADKITGSRISGLPNSMETNPSKGVNANLDSLERSDPRLDLSQKPITNMQQPIQQPHTNTASNPQPVAENATQNPQQQLVNPPLNTVPQQNLNTQQQPINPQLTSQNSPQFNPQIQQNPPQQQLPSSQTDQVSQPQQYPSQVQQVKSQPQQNPTQQQQPSQPQKNPYEEQKQSASKDPRNPNQNSSILNKQPEKPTSRGSTIGGGDEVNSEVGTLDLGILGMKPIVMTSGPMSHTFNKSSIKKKR